MRAGSISRERPVGWDFLLEMYLEVTRVLVIRFTWRVIFRFGGADVELVDYLDYPLTGESHEDGQSPPPWRDATRGCDARNQNDGNRARQAPWLFS